jgi:hypothetical protein
VTAGRGVIWPLLLIAAGFAFLLANFGYLPRLDIGRAAGVLWPLVLVLVGIDLALARRRPAVALALQLLVVAAGVGVLATRPDVAQSGALGGPVAQTVTVERQGARTATMRFSTGAGLFELTGGAAALLEARSESTDLRERVSRSGDRADVRLDQEFSGFSTRRAVSAKVASDIPMTIRVESGAGDFTIDLRDVRATDVRIQTGASSLTLVLPRPSGNVPVRVQAGASSIVIEVPGGVEAKVTTSGGLISTSGRTETPGYATATDRVTVTVEAGASSIVVR